MALRRRLKSTSSRVSSKPPRATARAQRQALESLIRSTCSSSTTLRTTQSILLERAAVAHALLELLRLLLSVSGTRLPLCQTNSSRTLATAMNLLKTWVSTLPLAATEQIGPPIKNYLSYPENFVTTNIIHPILYISISQTYLRFSGCFPRL